MSVGGEDIRPSRDVRSLLIPESTGFSRGEYVKFIHIYGIIIQYSKIKGLIFVIQVQAKLKLDNDEGDMVQLDVPEEYCNRKDFIEYIKKTLFDMYNVEYEVLDDRN